jgi:hypothetical protein
LKTFFLGAGASRGTFDLPVVPVAREFGEVLATVCPCWESEYPALARVVRHLGRPPSDWSLERVWSCIDYYSKLESALPLPKPWTNESREIKKAILAVYGRRCDDADAADNSTLAGLLRTLEPGDVLVSFNYDTIVERLASRLGCRLVATPLGVSGRGVRFAKPHGSVSWTLDLCTKAATWITPDGVPLSRSLSPQDVDCGREPLVLGAVPIKSELIREVQLLYGLPVVFDTIATQWRTVVEAIRDADTIVVVGYSFPEEDRYGRFMFDEGVRLRTGRLKVEFFERSDRQPAQAGIISGVFGERLNELVFRGPVLPRAA